jgi:hypothetical protein
MVGDVRGASLQQCAAALSPYFADPQNFFVISSDFCHWCALALPACPRRRRRSCASPLRCRGARFDYAPVDKSAACESPATFYHCVPARDSLCMLVLQRPQPWHPQAGRGRHAGDLQPRRARVPGLPQIYRQHVSKHKLAGGVMPLSLLPRVFCHAPQDMRSECHLVGHADAVHPVIAPRHQLPVLRAKQRMRYNVRCAMCNV